MGATGKIAVISHSFVNEVNQNRWKKFDGYEVHLIMPEYWESYWFKEKIVFRPKEVHKDNFHTHLLPATNVKNWNRYFLKGLCKKLKEINPDVIYLLAEERSLIHHQVYFCKFLYRLKSKIIFFSMNAKGVPYKITKNPLKKLFHFLAFLNIKKNTTSALVHYPGCLKSLRDGGYDKPIFIQTQVGVDEDIFKKDEKIRAEYKEKLNFKDKMVIGFCGRLSEAKGVDNIVRVFIRLAKTYPNLALLLVGDGDLREWIKKEVKNYNLENRVYISGFVNQEEVPNYMNAMDIFVLASKTMPNWIDTFPLVTVQAQAVGLPVVASNSGAIPWQLGDSAKIFRENNEEDLEAKLVEYIESEEERREFAKKGQKRSLRYFCHRGMNENLKKILKQVLKEKFVFHKESEEYTQWKAY